MSIQDDIGARPDTASLPSRRTAGLARHIGARVMHEAREALPPTLFFFTGFNLIVLTTNLLVAQYFVAVGNFMLATVAALAVGKAVFITKGVALIRSFDP